MSSHLGKLCRIADQVINGQRQLKANEIDKLIDDLLRLNNLFIGESEEGRVRVERLRRIRDERDKDV